MAPKMNNANLLQLQRSLHSDICDLRGDVEMLLYDRAEDLLAAGALVRDLSNTSKLVDGAKAPLRDAFEELKKGLQVNNQGIDEASLCDIRHLLRDIVTVLSLPRRLVKAEKKRRNGDPSGLEELLVIWSKDRNILCELCLSLPILKELQTNCRTFVHRVISAQINGGLQVSKNQPRSSTEAIRVASDYLRCSALILDVTIPEIQNLLESSDSESPTPGSPGFVEGEIQTIEDNLLILMRKLRMNVIEASVLVNMEWPPPGTHDPSAAILSLARQTLAAHFIRFPSIAGPRMATMFLDVFLFWFREKGADALLTAVKRAGVPDVGSLQNSYLGFKALIADLEAVGGDLSGTPELLTIRDSLFAAYVASESCSVLSKWPSLDCYRKQWRTGLVTCALEFNTFDTFDAEKTEEVTKSIRGFIISLMKRTWQIAKGGIEVLSSDGSNKLKTIGWLVGIHISSLFLASLMDTMIEGPQILTSETYGDPSAFIRGGPPPPDTGISLLQTHPAALAIFQAPRPSVEEESRVTPRSLGDFWLRSTTFYILKIIEREINDLNSNINRHWTERCASPPNAEAMREATSVLRRGLETFISSAVLRGASLDQLIESPLGISRLQEAWSLQQPLTSLLRDEELGNPEHFPEGLEGMVRRLSKEISGLASR